MQTLNDIKRDYPETIGEMTPAEMKKYAEELEAYVRQLEEEKAAMEPAYSVGREDIRYWLSNLLSIEENFVSEALIDDAFFEIKQQFLLEGESETFQNFLVAQFPLRQMHNEYTGILSGDGSVLHVYFASEMEMGEPDLSLSGDSVEAFLVRVVGEDYDEQIDSTPFTFDRSRLENFTI